VLALSRDLPRGRTLARELLDRRIALYRGMDGRVRALAARCPHLGADLWRFGGDGAEGAGRAPAFAYPVEERYGAIWVFSGPRALFPVPHFPDWERGGELLAARLAPKVIDCHAHLIASNGLDVEHFRTVHAFAFAREPVAEEPDPYRVRLRLEVLLRGHNLFEKAVRLLAGERVRAVFTTWGGNLATAEFEAGPVPVLAVFANRPLRGGRSACETFLLMPRARGALGRLGADRLALAVAKRITAYILREDTAVLEGLRFRSPSAQAGSPLSVFIRQVNAMSVLASEPEACEAASC